MPSGRCPLASKKRKSCLITAKKEAAARGVNRPESACGRVAMLVPVRTASVLTTASLAVKPVISAVETRQSLKPRGMNIGAIKRPMSASML